MLKLRLIYLSLIYNVNCRMYIKQCTVYIVKCTMYNLLRIIYIYVQRFCKAYKYYTHIWYVYV